MKIRTIEARDRDYFLAAVDAFYHSPAVCHEIPVRNAQATFDLLMRGTPCCWRTTIRAATQFPPTTISERLRC